MTYTRIIIIIITSAPFSRTQRSVTPRAYGAWSTDSALSASPWARAALATPMTIRML